jgi:hypothetical protein
VQIIKWNTRTDAFEHGQWFHGRIYEKRCDLSPDGGLMIYFAQKINRRTLQDRDYTYAWTAISRPPFLTALALWPKGDCWHGGGLFQDDKTVWLNHHPRVAIPHPEHRPRGLKILPNPCARGEDGPVLDRRLERDGWVRRQGLIGRVRGWYCATEQPQMYEKLSPDRVQTLEMTGSIKDFHWVFRFAVRQGARSAPIEGATWADWDSRGRLVFVRDGTLCAGHLDADGALQERTLADFNEARPRAIGAPGWASRW